MRSFVADGNFSADHVKQKRPADDVWLLDGAGMMTDRRRYAAHLKIALDSPKKGGTGCDNNFRAIDAANRGNAIYDATGIGCCACARHGCYAPGSVVDFQKGEKQMNMDWSHAEALNNTNIGEIPTVLLCYDVMCEYHVKLKDRIARNPLLHFPNVAIEKAIGLFHVHGHKDECFFRFATSFIPGAGIVDGEVLETLWSVLNNISRSTRTATLAHRAEILDDHMNDSNWKKMVGIVATVCRKYRRAVVNARARKEYHEDITAAAGADSVTIWTAEIDRAEARRMTNPKVMDLLGARIDRRMFPSVGLYANAI
jgi:hypothetical protein